MPDFQKIIQRCVAATLGFTLGAGLLVVLAQIKPFWVDEWRIIYNLKFKNAPALWGPLAYMQQFPRVYLVGMKWLTGAFGYSYTILRLPSFLVGSLAAVFSYRLAGRLWGRYDMTRFLFPAIIISCYTFTEYYVQVKQYTMDMLLSLVAIWQLLEMLKLLAAPATGRRYILLCLSFGVLPFFSYTYPVAVAPVYAIVLLQLFFKEDRRRAHLLPLLPLLLGAVSIIIFYVVDVRQLLQDQGMQAFWKGELMQHGFSWRRFVLNLYNTFVQAGTGAFFENLLAVIGIGGFVTGTIHMIRRLRIAGEANAALHYAVVLLVTVIVLFISGKLPVGEKRLSAYTIPSIAVLIIFCLRQMSAFAKLRKPVLVLTLIIYAGVLGNVYTTCINTFTKDDYRKRLSIYRKTGQAIIIAQQQRLPIIVTPGVAFPYDTTRDLPLLTTVPGDWVLKTYPAYNVSRQMPVYPAKDTAAIPAVFAGLPPAIHRVMAISGEWNKVMERN